MAASAAHLAMTQTPSIEAFQRSNHGPVLMRTAPHTPQVRAAWRFLHDDERGCQACPTHVASKPLGTPHEVLLMPQVVSNPVNAEHGTVPFNDPSQPLEYESDLFKGRALVLLRHLPSTPQAPFTGKRRQCYVVVQVGCTKLS